MSSQDMVCVTTLTVNGWCVLPFSPLRTAALLKPFSHRGVDRELDWVTTSCYYVVVYKCVCTVTGVPMHQAESLPPRVAAPA
jgi:hypothetical protein